MDYRIELDDLEARIFVTGRLTFNDHGKVRSMIQEMVQSHPKRQVMMIGGLEFVDSSGLGMILVAREEVAQVDKKLFLRGAQGQVKRVLSVAQLDKIVDIQD
ncbi:STAS domain-containing protein [Skermanella rosea]|uniref:STAS domain-containing protein n=1 Tax=Skermanella cutis TaxID=2775420 RepID=A0ABX7B1U1_9PROT|nr:MULTISPECIES: STAS domain-containing protein [Skermanella]QQP88268.1 STAS domain-containing protein [Skermanella sp. TT6]UEM05038.1 STAS domain-containing protein [Skermanella rosea]